MSLLQNPMKLGSSIILVLAYRSGSEAGWHSYFCEMELKHQHSIFSQKSKAFLFFHFLFFVFVFSDYEYNSCMYSYLENKLGVIISSKF